MFRLFVIALVVFGAHFVFSKVFPVQAVSVAFTLAGTTFTYLTLACVGCGLLAYKVTK